MRRIKSLASALVVALVVIASLDYTASAATGGKFILGQLNKANKQTTLKRTTSGTVLGLTTASASNAPLTTNGRGKVANLNADKLDGFDSTALRTGTYVFTKSVTAPTTDVSIPLTLPAGTYVFGYAAFMHDGGTSGGTAGCQLIRIAGGNTSYYGETAETTTAAAHPSVSGTAAITVGPGVTLTLDCFAPANFTTPANEPIQITATRTIVLGGGNLS